MQTFGYTVLEDTNNLKDNVVELSDYTIESLMAEIDETVAVMADVELV